MEEYTNQQGQCPKCHKYMLDYGPIQIEDDGMAYYPWQCDNCKTEGEEWYKLEFQGHNIYTENGEIIEL